MRRSWGTSNRQLLIGKSTQLTWCPSMKKRLIWTEEKQWTSFILTLAELSTISHSIQISQVIEEWAGLVIYKGSGELPGPSGWKGRPSKALRSLMNEGDHNKDDQIVDQAAHRDCGISIFWDAHSLTGQGWASVPNFRADLAMRRDLDQSSCKSLRQWS